MLSLVIAAGAFLVGGGEGDVPCEFNFASARVYSIAANNSPDPSFCLPPSNFYDGGATQNAFLVQYNSNSLNRDGFRTTLRGWQGNTVVLGRVAFTERRTNDFNLAPGHPRYFTFVSANHGEVQLIVSGNQLVLSHNFVGGAETENVVVRNLSPSDFVNGVLELDTRVVYNVQNGIDGAAVIEVCTKRGAGNCYQYSVVLPFFDTAPEFYMGDSIPANIGAMRARFCKLPALTSAGTGYSITCPGPVGPESVGGEN